MSTPTEVAELLDAKQWEPALEALLTAWREHRAPELERTIERLSAFLSRGVDAIDPDAPAAPADPEAGERGDWQDQWQQRALGQRSVELGVLLPLVTHPPKGRIPDRLRGILGFRPDPRIGAVLVAMVETPPLTASSNFSMWTELFAAMPAHVDLRAADRLRARMAERGGTSNFWTKLDAWITAVLKKLPEPGRLPKGWKTELTQLDRQIAGLAKGEAPTLEDPATVEVDHSWEQVDDLRGVRARLAAKDLPGALDLLVGFWAQRRSPTLAVLIERLAVLVDHELPPLPGTKPKDRHIAWLLASEHPQPSTIGPLLATLREGKLAELEAKLERTLEWRPDPRVAQVLVTLTKDYMIGARNRLWKAVYEGLVIHADPRVAEHVRQRHARLENANVAHRAISEGREIRRAFDALNEALDRDHDLTADQVEHAEAIAAALTEHVADDSAGDDLERELVAAIASDWDSAGPRQVYSDWLQSRQDPRGEWIALELAVLEGKRVKGARDKWFKQHKAEILGPLAGLCPWDGAVKYERGVIQHIAASTTKGGLEIGDDRRRELLGDLRWATVRSLSVSYSDAGSAEIFAHAPLLGLQHLERPSLVALRGFGRRSDSLPLRSLEISAQAASADEDWVAFGELARVLPQVRELEVMIWGQSGGRLTPPPPCFAGALVRQVDVLRNGGANTGGVARIDEWIEAMITSKCPVPTLHVIGPELTAEIQQRELGEFEIDLTLDHLRWLEEDAFRSVIASLTGLPRERVAKLRLRLGTVIDDAARPLVDEALAGLNVERD